MVVSMTIDALILMFLIDQRRAVSEKKCARRRKFHGIRYRREETNFSVNIPLHDQKNVPS